MAQYGVGYISKLVSVPNTFLPIFKTQLMNKISQAQAIKVSVLYRHSKSKRNHCNNERIEPVIRKELKLKGRKRLPTRHWCSLWKSSEGETVSQQPKLNKSQPNLKFPGLVNIRNLIKTQPNFKWNALWSLDDKKPLEWPVFNRSIQHANGPEITLKHMLSRLHSKLPPLCSEKEAKEILEQRYLPQRVRNLGPDLAAIHFFTERRAAVRLTGHGEWIVGGAPKLTSTGQLKRCVLGSFLDEERYVSGCHIEAVDCSNFHYNGIRFEGLKYLTGLKFLKWLSLRNQKHINVWCLDRIAGCNGTTLEYLDISKCDLDVGCISALSRMKELQKLLIKNPGKNIKVHKALLCLEEQNPHLEVKTFNTVYT